MSEELQPEVLMLIKSRIKQHQRKTPTGKITTVREHEDIRTKKADDAKKNKGAKAESKNSPAKIGKMLASRGVPISQNDKGKQVSGIAIRQSNNGKNIVMEYKDWENKGDRHTVMNQVRNQLKAVGLDISVKDGTEKYYIHTSGANFFGHGDFPDDKPKPKGGKEARAKMRESTAGIMDMLDSTHSKQAEESKKAEADKTQEKPAKGGDVGVKDLSNKKVGQKTLKLKDLEVDEAGVAIAKNTFIWNKNPKLSNEPVSVTLNKETGKYHLEDGYHRYINAKKNGDENIKANIFENISEANNGEAGLKDLPKSLREKCQRADPGKGGEITLTKKDVTTLLKKGRVGLISAGVNPKDKSSTDQSKALKKDLIEKGLKFVKVKGKYGKEEDSFMVMIPDAEKTEMIELGKKYNQDSVIYSDRNKNELIYTTGKKAGTETKGNGFNVLDSGVSDYYTEIKTSKGIIKFSLNFDFGLPTQIKKSNLGLLTQIPNLKLPAKLFKSTKGSVKPGHKYIERKGAPGDYDYKYKDEKQHSIFDKPKAKITETKVLDLAVITPDPGQPREEFNEADLLALGRSIRDLGLIQEIAVRPDPTDKTKYIIIAGERRYRASKLVGLNTIRSRIYNIEDPQAIYAIQVAENVGRKEMNPIETARAFKRLFDAGVSIESIAVKVGSSPLTVKRKMMLITLTDAIQNLVKHGNLPLNQAYIIAMAELRPEYQNNVMRRLNAGKISSEALSGLVGKYKKAQSQTSMFGSTGKTTLADAINGTRLKKLERDTVKLIEDIGKTLASITKDGGSKILPAIAKEKGKLAVVAKKLDMATSEMIKLNRDMKRAQEYFNSGGTVSQYIRDKKLAKKKARKLKKSIDELAGMFEPQLPKLIKSKKEQ